MTNWTDTEMLNFMNTHSHGKNALRIHTLPGGFHDSKGGSYKDIRGLLTAAMEAAQKKEIDAAWDLLRETEGARINQPEAGPEWHVWSAVCGVGRGNTREKALLVWYRKHKQQEQASEQS